MNDNLPAGAQYDSRAPWNQEDPEPRYQVLTNEYWEGEESKGFEVLLLEVDDEGYMLDELELWYNYDITNETEVEFVDEYNTGTDFEEAKRFFKEQVEFYTNEYTKDNG